MKENGLTERLFLEDVLNTMDNNQIENRHVEKHPIVLSHIQADQLLEARRGEERVAHVSLDLGRTHQSLSLEGERVVMPGGAWLDWAHVAEVADNPNGCYAVVGANQIDKVQRFSPEFNRLYTLMPASATAECPPTMLISGIPMHRIKDTDPQKDTKAKIAAVKPFTGPVLDTATGLGYTAIAAAQSGQHITTIELDPAVIEICRLNPWSKELFERPNITQLLGDADDVVRTQESEAFTQIIHDPPMFSLAGHLYSADFYRELLRVLRKRGRLFHYIGNPDSKSGRSVTNGVVRRLQEVGFSRIRPRPQAFGVIAHKP